MLGGGERAFLPSSSPRCLTVALSPSPLLPSPFSPYLAPLPRRTGTRTTTTTKTAFGCHLPRRICPQPSMYRRGAAIGPRREAAAAGGGGAVTCNSELVAA